MTAPRKGDTVLEVDAQQQTAARPDRGQAEDGKSGGRLHTGAPGASNAPGDGGGLNAQSGARSGAETERQAPGMSTDKNADDTK